MKGCIGLKEAEKLELIKKEDKGIRKIEMLVRTISVIEYIFQNKSVTFTDIVENLGVAKSTLHRILYTLESRDYIVKDEDTNEYKLGLIFAYYGEEVKSNLTIINICENILNALALEIGESVNLNLLYKDSVLNLLTLDGEKSVLTSKLAPISPLNCSSSGKVFLAQKNDMELLNYFNGVSWEKRTINSITSYEDFKEEKEKILRDEVSYDNEEYEYGLFCIAKPLKNHNGLIDVAISITGPITRMKMKNIEDLKNRLTIKVNLINEILIKTRFIINNHSY